MGMLREFREFIMRGNVVDLAVGVIIGAAFGRIVSSLVEDIIMPPIGRVVGNVDFTNLYISLSDKIDAANVALVAATQPGDDSMVAGVVNVFDTAARLPLVEARKLGPVIAYGNFITLLINFLIIAFCIFLIVQSVNRMRRRFEREKAAQAPPPPAQQEVLLAEIRDILKQKAV
jgi:large conductance mechanosensitive channel